MSELLKRDINVVEEYLVDYDWDTNDPDMWPEGNKFQNKFVRSMFDYFAEILLLYINNEAWHCVEYLTSAFLSPLFLAKYFINYEA